MCNAITKFITAGALALALAACSDADKDGATALYGEAQQLIDSKQYTQALVTLDTLNARYPAQTEVRRGALNLRAQAMQGIALDSIETSSRALAEATVEVERLKPQFKHIDSSVGLEGYYIPNSAQAKVMSATGIQPRVSDEGFFYLVVNIQGRNIGFNTVEFVDGAESVTSTPISASRVVRVEGSETASLNPEDIEAVGPWLIAHPKCSKAVLLGTKGKVPVKLDSKLRAQLDECYLYAKALQDLRLASIKREKYERMLATARDQLANNPEMAKEK